MRATTSSWLASFVVLFGLNGVFHTFLAAPLYDAHLQGVMSPMAQANPVPIALTDGILVLVMAVLLFGGGREQRPTRADGARIGALTGLAASATYNLVNSAMVARWPMLATTIDIVWHVALGAMAGVVLTWIHGLVDRRRSRV